MWAFLDSKGHVNVLLLSACSTYAPVKSFLRVDKEKVSSHLPLVHPHLNGNSTDSTHGVPSLVAQVSPSALPEPSAGMRDPLKGHRNQGT